jgi:hypothetical protein
MHESVEARKRLVITSQDAYLGTVRSFLREAVA